VTVAPANLLFLMSDEHNRALSGCYGHPVVQTPNIDSLARRGVRFSRGYCNSPICVAARASLATGRYVHQLRTWDNSAPYTGTFASWGHRLVAEGHKVSTIGKLHFRSTEDDTGYPDQRLAMHVEEGTGDLYALLRTTGALPRRPKVRERITKTHVGESEYSRYDRAVAGAAENWLRTEAGAADRPWVLFVSFATPHYPLTAPKEFADMYSPTDVVLPKQYGLNERPRHPVLEAMRSTFDVDDEFDEGTIRRALAAYYALCTFMDAQVGRVLKALDESGLAARTRVIYTSDHGDTLGEHGLWWKYSMYEGSAGVPFILAGPGVPQGTVVDTNVSHVDCFPTILENAGVAPRPEDRDLPGRSLFTFVDSGAKPEARAVFGEYHAAGSITGYFMIRGARFKLIEYVGFVPQLFDLGADPDEQTDLAANADYADMLREMSSELRRVCDPVAVDREARADQTRVLEAHGGADAVRRNAHEIGFTKPPSQHG
jgi:choline-sulfatase